MFVTVAPTSQNQSQLWLPKQNTTDWAWTTEIHFLRVLEAAGPGSRRGQGWFLLRSLSSSCRQMATSCRVVMRPFLCALFLLLIKTSLLLMSNLPFLLPLHMLIHLDRGRKHALIAACVHQERQAAFHLFSAFEQQTRKPPTWGLLVHWGLHTPFLCFLLGASCDGMLKCFSRACSAIQPCTHN